MKPSSNEDLGGNESYKVHNRILVALLVALVFVAPFWLNCTVASAKAWNLVSHTMARNLSSELKPIGMTTKFSTNEEKAVSWFEIEFLDLGPAFITGRVTFSWKWYEPSGSLYRQQTKSETLSLRERTSLWDELKISGSAAERKTGEWKIRVSIDEDQLFEEIFRIEPAETYSVKVTVSGLESTYRAGVRINGVLLDHLSDGTERRIELRLGTAGNISVDPYVQGRTGERYVCAPSSIIVNVAVDVSFIYEKECYLTVSSAYGSPRGERWYGKGSSAAFSVTSPAAGGVGVNYVFQRWAGDVASASPSATVLMDGPKTVTAIWLSDYTQLYAILAIALLFVFAMVLLPVTKRWHASRASLKRAGPSRKCPACGKPAVFIPKGSRYYCSNCKRYT